MCPNDYHQSPILYSLYHFIKLRAAAGLNFFFNTCYWQFKFVFFFLQVTGTLKKCHYNSYKQERFTVVHLGVEQWSSGSHSPLTVRMSRVQIPVRHFCGELACSPCVDWQWDSSRYSGFLTQSKNMHEWSIGDPKLLMWLCLWVCPRMDCWPDQVYPALTHI